MKQLELYIHIPFCVQKCAYCDFLSAPSDFTTKVKYMARLGEEIAFYQEQFADYEVTSVFIGGGTPSILDSRSITELMTQLKDNFQIREDAEITMECNPGTLSLKKAQAMKEAGINRISLGLQSTDDLELAMLGRIHTWGEFLQSFEYARKAGFNNINVDLMSGLPGQKLQTWQNNLKKVTALRPEHISAYSLIIEEGTKYYDIFYEDMQKRDRGEKPRLLPTEELEREMYYETERILTQRGYEHYEISNYAKPGYHCRHNVGYWTRKEYLGLGLGAASLIDETRFQNTSILEEYLEQPFEHQQEMKLSRKERMEEHMFLGLRLMHGVERKDFFDAFGVELDQIYAEQIEKLTKQGLLASAEGRVYLTDIGIDLSNQVMAEFLLD